MPALGTIFRTAAAATVLAVALAVMAACADGEDCDADEVTAYDADCGYWAENPGDPTGDAVFVWYPWVTPGTGGSPPQGKHPTPPAGAKLKAAPAKPPAAPANPKGNKPAAPPRGGVRR